MKLTYAGRMAELYCSLLLDIAVRHELTEVCWFCTSESDSDFALVLGRSDDEVVRFLTKTLPSFGRSLDRYLTTGEMVLDEPPLRLIKLLVAKFCTSDEPGVLADIRQLSYLFYKYELPYEPEAAQAVIDSFVSTEAEIARVQVDPDCPIIKRARAIVARVLGGIDPRAIKPRHGPGAVATGENVLEKTDFSRIYQELEAVYPFTEYMCFSLSHVVDRYRSFKYLEELKAGTAKVVLVPKDSRGPRLISCEPLEYQWIQQGLGQLIVDRLESHRLTAGHVNFTDQEVNRKLALEGSLTRKWDTLDMKDASDRVSLQLVKELFSGTKVLEGLLASRTPATMLPNGQIVNMCKFAPMGSALCFPVEALVFYSLSVAALQVRCGWSLKRASRAVYVYGDDLVVLAGNFPLLKSYFDKVGLKFNESKCATSEVPFRESCGVDAYKGVLVTPLRVKSPWSDQLDPMELASWVAYGNAFWQAGFYSAAHLIERWVTRQYVLPVTRVMRSYLSWVRPSTSLAVDRDDRFNYRFNRRFQRMEIKAYSLAQVTVKTGYDDWESLLRWYTNHGERTRAGTYSLPRRAKLNLGWAMA